MPKASADAADDSRDPSSGKLFIGGLSWETTTEKLTNHFKKYGELIDSVVMKDRATGHPRGFGYVTFSDPSVCDRVIKLKHILDGRTVDIKRSIPRENTIKGPKTKKIFVGGIPTSITEEEFKNYFAKFGKVVEHQIMQFRSTGRSRGFGFITFDSERVVDEILAQGSMIELGGKQVEIKRAEPKETMAERSAGNGLSTGRGNYGPGAGDYGGYGDFGGFDRGAYGGPYRSESGWQGERAIGGYGGGGYGSSGYGGYGLGGYGTSEYGGGSLGAYGSHYGSSLSYDGLGAGYGGGVVGGGYGDFGGYGGSSYGGGYGSSGGAFSGAYGSSRYGAGGNSRYHPYGRI